MIDMLISWVAILSAGAFGIYHLLVNDSYFPFFLSVGAAWLFSFMLHARGHLGLMLPFIQRLDQLQKTLKNEKRNNGRSA